MAQFRLDPPDKHGEPGKHKLVQQYHENHSNVWYVDEQGIQELWQVLEDHILQGYDKYLIPDKDTK